MESEITSHLLYMIKYFKLCKLLRFENYNYEKHEKKITWV